jgi:unsaturated chondroitin disaccharide hydrolase
MYSIGRLLFFLNHLPASTSLIGILISLTVLGSQGYSSALAITICGMQEMAGLEPDGFSCKRNVPNFRSSLRILWKECAVTGVSVSNGLLLHGTYAKKSP